MKTIIAGSRGVTSFTPVEIAVAASGFPVSEVVSGGARGVDRLGERWAALYRVPVRKFIPDWDGLGKGAGYARNVQMAAYADALVAVWDGVSRGTRHMIRTARDGGLKVFVLVPQEDGIELVHLSPEELAAL